jgi:hypothetical protein
MSWRLAGTNYGGGVGPPGPPGPPGPGGGISESLINEDGVAVLVCAPVYSSSAGKFKQARANAVGTSQAIGLVIDVPSVANTVAGNVQTSGTVTKTTAQWDAVTGDVGGLVQGSQYWVSAATKGKLVRDPAPSASGNFDVLIGEALDTVRLLLQLPVQPIGPIP